MCTKIKPELVLAKLLEGSEREVTISVLKGIRRAVEDAFPSVYLDVTFDSLCSAVQGHSEMFAWRNNTIIRAGNAAEFFDGKYLDNAFYCTVPESIRKQFLETLEQNAGQCA